MVRSMPVLLLMLSMGFPLAQLTVGDPCAPKPGGGGDPGPGHGGDSPPHEPTKCHEEGGMCINPHCDTCPPDTHERADFCPGHRICCVPGPSPPFGCCELFSDPHIRTFDGHSYDVQSLGEFEISKPCNGNPFKISAKFVSPYTGAFWSKIGEVKIETGSTSIVLTSIAITLNGNNVISDLWTVNNQVRIYVIGYNMYVLLKNFDVLVCYNRKTMALRVYVGLRWKNKLCGLCDNFNGDTSDDGTAAAPATGQVCPRARPHTDWVYCERQLKAMMENCTRINTGRYKRLCAIDMCLGGENDAAFTLDAAREHCNGPDVMEQMNQEAPTGNGPA